MMSEKYNLVMNINILKPVEIFLFSLNGVLFFWLILISFLFFQMKKHYNRLLGKADQKSLQKTLDDILKVQNEYNNKYDKLKSAVEGLEKDGKFHLQKIGFKRFNPFGETGGDQSFSTAILDEHKNGIVFSALHGRDTTRVYAKQVKKGKADMSLSKEEESVIANVKSSKS